MTELWVDASKGNDTNNGSQDSPLQTPEAALKKISGNGDYVHLKGTFYNGMKIKCNCVKPLVIDGNNETMFWGFEGPERPIDVANMPNGTWGTIGITDAHNIILKKFKVYGGSNQSIDINDSYPNIGLKNITLDGIEVKYGPSRGIFMGGNNIDGISILNCKVSQTIYGDVTHGIYLSGGHWNGTYPPVKNIKIHNTLVEYTGGRHCIQLNGRFQDVEISNNILRHGQIAGLSLIGCKDVKVFENQMYGNNRWCMVIYDYIDDDYWNIMGPEEKEKWLACHHPTRNIYVYNNTLVQAYQPFRTDKWHGNDYPYNRPPIIVNNAVSKTIPSFRMGNIVIGRNILWSKWPTMVGFSHNHEAVETFVKENIMYVDNSENPWMEPGVSLPYGQEFYTIPWLEENADRWYSDNIITNPEFKQNPVYDYINQEENPLYNWDNHKSEANLYSEIGTEKGWGNKFKNHPWANKEGGA